MTIYLYALAILLLLTLLVGIARLIKGPTMADRMLAAQLFGTTGVAVLIVLAIVQSQAALINAALVLALLTPITMMTFISLSKNT